MAITADSPALIEKIQQQLIADYLLTYRPVLAPVLTRAERRRVPPPEPRFDVCRKGWTRYFTPTIAMEARAWR